MPSASKINDETLLDHVETVHIPATTTPFTARDKFVIGTNIRYLGQDFIHWFLSGDGLIEGPADASKLEVASLQVSSTDGPVIKEIGGILYAKTKLTQVFLVLSLESTPRIDSGRHVFFVPQPVTKLDGPQFSYSNNVGELVEEKVSSSEYLFEVDGQWQVLRGVCVRLQNESSFVNAYAINEVGTWRRQSRVYYPGSNAI